MLVLKKEPGFYSCDKDLSSAFSESPMEARVDWGKVIRQRLMGRKEIPCLRRTPLVNMQCYIERRLGTSQIPIFNCTRHCSHSQLSSMGLKTIVRIRAAFWTARWLIKSDTVTGKVDYLFSGHRNKRKFWIIESWDAKWDSSDYDWQFSGRQTCFSSFSVRWLFEHPWNTLEKTLL